MPITPDVPAAQTTQAVQDDAVQAAKNVVEFPGVASGVEALHAVEEAAGSPTAHVLEADILPLIKETKAGWKTTEFWAGIAAALNDVISTLPPTDKVAITGLAAVYALARGIAKNGIPFISAPGAPE